MWGLPDFFERSHLSGQDRWQPSTFRMGTRHILGYEPLQGVAAALKASGGGMCPSGCGQCLRGYEVWSISNHLMSCAVGGGTQRVAKAMNNGLGRVFRDIGVKCAAELAGLSAMSAHRPGDMVAEPMTLPERADAGGSHQWTMDSTMAYFNATTALLAARDPLKVLANEERWQRRRRQQRRWGKR
jgi:hypothetical protein